MENTITVKDLKKGQFFTKKAIDYPRENQVWIRGSYDRTEKKYECCRYDDVNTVCYMQPSKIIYTDFIF